MAKIISLGCEVADVYRRYAEVHRSLFGAYTLREVLEAVIGRGGCRYGNCQRTLTDLNGRLVEIEGDVAALEGEEKPPRAADQMHAALVEYIRALKEVIACLSLICRHLAEDERQYRQAGADGRSSFSRDKIQYDRAISKLERVGTRLKKLFSSY